MRPSRTTSVSTPSTGRSPAPSAIERAFARACKRTSSTASTPSTSSSSYRGAITSKGMPSCSSIARRCGDREASRSGGAGAGSAMQAGLPDVFDRPAPRPFGVDVVVVLRHRRVRRRFHLEQPLDLEAVRAQQLDPVAVREVVLDSLPLVVRPGDRVHAELGPQQLLDRTPYIRR